MSWRDAPLYVETHDLAVWVLERVASPAAGGAKADLRPQLAGAACDLVEVVSLALTFPEGRARQLQRADEAVVRLRTRLRLSCELGHIAARGLRFSSSG